MSLIWAVLTSFLWGATDPLMRKYGRPEEDPEDDDVRGAPAAETSGGGNNPLRHLLSLFFGRNGKKYFAAFLANQLGSLTFALALADPDARISDLVPVTGGLKFFFTYLTGKFIGERTSGDSRQEVVGTALVLSGIYLLTAPPDDPRRPTLTAAN